MTREKLTTAILWCLVFLPFAILISAWTIRIAVLPEHNLFGTQLPTI